MSATAAIIIALRISTEAQQAKQCHQNHLFHIVAFDGENASLRPKTNQPFY
jgi:hypothetical protein